MKMPALFALAPLAAAVVIAGCGGSGGSASQSKTAASTAGGTTPTVELAASKFGKILVDSHGRTLYTKPGETTGQAINQFGAPWYVLTANGTEIHNG